VGIWDRRITGNRDLSLSLAGRVKITHLEGVPNRSALLSGGRKAKRKEIRVFPKEGGLPEGNNGR